METVYIAGEHAFVVRIDQTGAPRSAQISIAIDGDAELVFDESGWCPMVFGSSREFTYFWSARSLHVLLFPSDERPEPIIVDEDLLFAFRIAIGWLLVCETSLRLIRDGHQVDRVDLGEVVRNVRLVEDSVHVVDTSGRDYHFFISHKELSESPPIQ
jgi:hypothetical protein